MTSKSEEVERGLNNFIIFYLCLSKLFIFGGLVGQSKLESVCFSKVDALRYIYTGIQIGRRKTNKARTKAREKETNRRLMMFVCCLFFAKHTCEYVMCI